METVSNGLGSEPLRWTLDQLRDEAAAELALGAGSGHEHDGRIVKVLARPEDTPVGDVAIGVSALPPGYRTPTHQHRSEEVALVLEGAGELTIGDRTVAVTRGDVVHTPADVAHATASREASPLIILWLYIPAASAVRWLANDPAKTTEE